MPGLSTNYKHLFHILYFVFFSTFIIHYFSFVHKSLYCSSFINPTYIHTLLILNQHFITQQKRYSALDVNKRYGSKVPFVTKSSIKTPIYSSFRFKINGSLPSSFKEALIRRLILSSCFFISLVPFICPA